ncbi:MAG TPA: hypothetical protein VF721_01330 [Pyrinomonadaceae bacterium]|jgi:hypothetical protein
MSDPGIFKHEFTAQRQWLESKSAGELKDKLRDFIWTKFTYPLVIPQITDLVTQLVSLVNASSPETLVKIRTVIPQLLQEWGSKDSTETLTTLFLLCGKLRCADAETGITQILNSRLSGRDESESTELRKMGLSVLSGFGCSDKTIYLFERYITQAEYAAVCYRALYEYHPSNAAVYLPVLISFPEHEFPRVMLKMNIKQMLKYLSGSRERSAFWEQVLCIPEVDIHNTLRTLSSIGIHYHPPEFVESEFNEQIPIVYEESLGWRGFSTDYLETEKLFDLLGHQYKEDSESRYFELMHILINIHEEKAPVEVKFMTA